MYYLCSETKLVTSCAELISALVFLKCKDRFSPDFVIIIQYSILHNEKKCSSFKCFKVSQLNFTSVFPTIVRAQTSLPDVFCIVYTSPKA